MSVGEPGLLPPCCLVELAGTNFLLSLLSSTQEASSRIGLDVDLSVLLAPQELSTCLSLYL